MIVFTLLFNTTFNLNDIGDEKEDGKASVEPQNDIQPGEQQLGMSNHLEIINVKSQVDVQSVVDVLKNGEKVLINISGLKSTDVVRSLDFLTGAVYALGRVMQKVEDAIYLIQ